MDKLSLHRETVRRLTAEDAAVVAAGRRYYDLYTIGCHTGFPTCITVVPDCAWSVVPGTCAGS